MRSNSDSQLQGRDPAGPQDSESERHPGRGPGRLFIVSLGPGGPSYMAPVAREALERARAVVGYKTYMELVDPDLLVGKDTLSTGMKGEVERCRAAVKKCLEGKDTALVSSGDAGIYGMAGLALEVLEGEGAGGLVEVEVIPGIPALAAAAALLGAPLMHDFAVISLSDLLTPWEAIRRRTTAAAEADFVIVLYNPRSRKRQWQLARALEIIMASRGPQTPVGVVRNAAREGQSATITSLSELDPETVDMLSIIIAGNSTSRVMGGRMVTPRGYSDKYRIGKPDT